MHHVGNFDVAALQPPLVYEQHSQGYSRVALVDHTIPGAVHMGLGVCQLVPAGILRPHVHVYEESFFILEGEAVLDLDGRAYHLAPNDYGFIPFGVPHAWRGVGERPARWLEMLAMQPRPLDGERDTFFLDARAVPEKGVRPDFQDLRTRYLGHFDDGQMPPPAQLQGVGYNGSNIYGISIKSLVDQMLGAQHLTLFMVEFQPGGDGNIHDHPFEESYFLLSGEAEAILDGKSYHVKAGDYVWTGVGSTHGFFNRGTVPVRWIETQSPQPPSQKAFRFPSEWQYLAKKLDID